MLSYTKSLNPFGGDALKTAIDIINISPSVPSDGAILEKIWSRKVSYNHLKVFDYRAIIHIPKDEQVKLDSKANECIYLGSPRGEFDNRLCDPINRRIARS